LKIEKPFNSPPAIAKYLKTNLKNSVELVISIKIDNMEKNYPA